MYSSAVLLTFIFVVVNIFGTEKAAKLEMIMIFILIPLIFLFIVSGFHLVDVDNFEPFLKTKDKF